MLASESELAPLATSFPEKLKTAGREPGARAALLRELYGAVMKMPQTAVDSMLDPLVGRLEADEAAGRLDREAPGFWALRAARTFPLPAGHRDRGIFSIYMLNLVHLRPGQGTYQPVGTLHAYLEGSDVELMANSDNVLRGGLTPKHVDGDELLATLSLPGRAAADPRGQGNDGNKQGIRDTGRGVCAGKDRCRLRGALFRREGTQRGYSHRHRGVRGGRRGRPHAPAPAGRMRARARRRALLDRGARLESSTVQGRSPGGALKALRRTRRRTCPRQVRAASSGRRPCPGGRRAWPWACAR